MKEDLFTISVRAVFNLYLISFLVGALIFILFIGSPDLHDALMLRIGICK